MNDDCFVLSDSSGGIHIPRQCEFYGKFAKPERIPALLPTVARRRQNEQAGQVPFTPTRLREKPAKRDHGEAADRERLSESRIAELAARPCIAHDRLCIFPTHGFLLGSVYIEIRCKERVGEVRAGT